MLLKCHARDSVDGDEDDAAAAAKHNAANHSGNERAHYDTYRIGSTSGVKALWWGHGAFKIVFPFHT